MTAYIGVSPYRLMLLPLIVGTDLTVAKKFVPVFFLEAAITIILGSNRIHPHLAIPYVLACGGSHMICILVSQALQRSS